MTHHKSIAKALNLIQGRIDLACEAAGRKDETAALMAVSKMKQAPLIEEALKAGQRLFGENKVQEAQDKWPALKEKYPEAEVHLIGPLQTNKARAAVRLFDAIQSVDRPKLAQILARVMEEEGRKIPIYIQVNTGEEEQKAGVVFDALDEFYKLCRDDLGLKVAGLMCIPPANDHPGPHFALLKRTADRLGIAGLSMGMSGDYEQAVWHGATLVRLGTSIFGARPKL